MRIIPYADGPGRASGLYLANFYTTPNQVGQVTRTTDSRTVWSSKQTNETVEKWPSFQNNKTAEQIS